jgi:hypothetical protein
MDEEWHELESKQRKRAQKALEKEARRASSTSQLQENSSAAAYDINKIIE